MQPFFSKQTEDLIPALFSHWDVPRGQQAKQLLEQAAEQGDGSAQALLAWCYSDMLWNGFIFDADHSQTENYLKQALQNGSQFAVISAMIWSSIIDDEMKALLTPEAMTSAFQALKQLANTDQPLYQCLLGACYSVQAPIAVAEEKKLRQFADEEQVWLHMKTRALHWHEQALKNKCYIALDAFMKVSEDLGNIHDAYNKKITGIYDYCLREYPHPAILFYYAGWLRELGQDEQAFDYYKQAADQADNDACYNMSEMLKDQGKLKEALWYVRLLVNKGVPYAYYAAGILYRKIKDHENAYLHYKKSAEVTGNDASYLMLGTYYYFGIGTEQDLELSAKYFQQAAMNGYASAQGKMGGAYFCGYGVPRNYQKSAYWLFQADEQNNEEEYPLLAYFYLNGLGGLAKNYATAWQYLHRVEERLPEYPPSFQGMTCNMLGEMYADGLFVEQDIDQAVAYFQQAEQFGDNDAAINLTYFKKNPFGRWLKIDDDAPIYEQEIDDSDDTNVAANTDVIVFSEAVSRASHMIWGNWQVETAQQGRQILEQEAAQGDADALCLLSHCYRGSDYVWHGFGFTEDRKKADALLMESVQKGSALAVLCAIRCMDDLQPVLQAMPYNSFKEAYDIVLAQARAGEGFCQHTLGETYYYQDLLCIFGEEYFKQKFPNKAYYEKYTFSLAGKWLERAFCNGISFYPNHYCSIYDEQCLLENINRLDYWLKFVAEKGNPIFQRAYGDRLAKQGDRDAALTWYQASLAGGHIDTYISLGQLWKQENNLPDAIEAFQKLAEYGRASGYYSLAVIREDEGNIQAAMELYQKAIALGETWGYTDIARLLQGMEQFAEAEKYYLQSIQAGNDATAYYHFAAMQMKQERFAEAAANYKQAIANNLFIARNDLAYALVKLGCIDEAVFNYKMAVNAGGERECINLVRLLYKQGDLETATEYARRLIAMNPSNESAYPVLAMLLEKQGNIDEAIENYRQSVANGDTDSCDDFERLMLEQQRGDELLAFYQQLANVDNPVISLRLAQLLYNNNEADKAFPYYRQAAESGDTTPLIYFARRLAERGEFAQAENCFRRAAESGDNRVLNELACFLEEQGNMDEAITYYKKAIDAGNINAMRDYAHYLCQQGQFAQARRYYLQIMEQGYMMGACHLGVMYFQRDKLSRAAFYFRKAADSNDGSKDEQFAWYMLGRIKHQTRNYPKAMEYYQRAIAIEEGNDCSAASLRRLGDIQFTKKDFQQARDYYLQSAGLDHEAGQGKLAYLYFIGKGVEQDYQQAVHWLLKAENDPPQDALPLLGYCYLQGLHVPPDQQKALRYLTDAMQYSKQYDNFLKGLLYNTLGEMYADGLQVTEDAQEAVRLFKLASANGYEQAAINLQRFTKQGIFGRWIKKPA